MCASSSTSPSTGAPRSRPSRRTCRHACASTCCAWRTSTLPPSRWSSTRSVRAREHAHRRADGSNAGYGADGVSRVHVVAVAQRQGRRQEEVDPRHRGRVGLVGDGPSGLFPRANELPAGPPSDDAVLVTCAYLTDPSKPWVMQSLFLTAIGEARERGGRALEAFAYRYPEGDRSVERFHIHRTIFPSDFLADFGFVTVRAQGRVELARLELGGLVPVAEGTRERVLRVVREAFLP